MTVVDRSGRPVGVWQEEFGTVISGLTSSPGSEQLVTTRFPRWECQQYLHLPRCP